MTSPVPAPVAPPGLSLGGLETVYDQLATAIDEVGPDKAQLFLVKLALLQAQAVGDEADFAKQLAVAKLDL
jgi:hypothetical protein